MEQELDALRTVIAASRVERFDLMGASLGAAVAATWAAGQPATVSRLVLYGGWACGADVATPEIQRHVLGLVRQHWGLASDLLTDLFAPDADAATRAAFTRYQRESADAETAGAMVPSGSSRANPAFHTDDRATASAWRDRHGHRPDVAAFE
jgi:pimeloyl-ACP methyl ester carboxylesterase